MEPIREIPLQSIREAAERIRPWILRTPLIPLHVETAPRSIFLKLENLQPIGSFKLRGAGNAVATADPEALRRGVYTASAGNMAQGVAWNASRLNIPCSVVVPDHAPETKCAAVERLGGHLVKVPFDRWWRVIVEHGYPGIDQHFIHPVSDPAVIAGNGTIGLEILEDQPDVDTVLVPYGGGGLACGIASAIKALKSDTRVFACEVATAAPLAASLQAGAPQEVEYTPSLVDGIGSRSVLPEMWPLARRLLDGSLVCSIQEVVESLKLLLERNRVVAEGAGAVPVAAALSGKVPGKTIVCVISGGNIDLGKLFAAIEGRAL